MRKQPVDSNKTGFFVAMFMPQLMVETDFSRIQNLCMEKENSTMNKMQDKVTIITGAASGMGAETARLMAEEGAILIALDVQDELLETVAEEIRASGGRVTCAHVDVTKAEDWKTLVEKVIEDYGRIDTLINVAGGAFGSMDTVETLTPELFDRIVALNLKGPFLGMKYVTQEMKKQNSGTIVNVSSVGGMRASYAVSAYAAAKSGLGMLGKTMVEELMGYNIRINTVWPGFIVTPLSDYFLKEENKELLDQYCASIPLKRPGLPPEVAKSILFLACDDSSFISGEDLVIDGGYSILAPR